MSENQRYQVVERIAAGGMAEVYRGESAGIEGFRKRVAIKRVLPKLSQNREFIRMFLDEARLCAYLNHSRCVQVFDIGQGAGAHFIVMEFVDGADLQALMEFVREREQAIPVEMACFIALGMCEGLSYAHQACDHTGRPLDIVHRDISPHNVLITRHGEVKLVDFGLAKASTHLAEEDTDIIKGKFGYLAPEVTLGQPSDKRVDIFAAGIVLWEMLAGRRLFKGNTDAETFHQVRAAVVPDIREIRPDASEGVARVLTKALARDPKQRYSDGDEFARDLSLLLLAGDRPITYLDVGRMVRVVSDERAKRRKAEGKDTQGMMGDLILETLHDFSGVIEDLAPMSGALGTRGVERGAGDFVDPSAWGLDDLFAEEKPKAAPPPPPRAAAAPAPVPAIAAAAPPPPRAQAVPTAGVPPAPQPSAAERARASASSDEEKKEGPFWKKWFGS